MVTKRAKKKLIKFEIHGAKNIKNRIKKQKDLIYKCSECANLEAMIKGKFASPCEICLEKAISNIGLKQINIFLLPDRKPRTKKKSSKRALFECWEDVIIK